MKRLHKITALVMMVMMLVGLTACSKKTAISVNEFGASAEITKNIMNYSYYSASTSSTFYMLAQIDNTMLYVEADVAYKDEIVEIVKELGY